MSQIITFENTILGNAGKRGSLKPMDSSGYYRINAGGFNIPNRYGITYILNQYLKECMRKGSDLERRVNEGQVYCELGHPPMYYNLLINGQVVRKQITELFEWINRLRTIDMDNVCGHIRKIHWIMTGNDQAPVYNDIEVIPFGPKGIFLEQSLPNPDINTAFSIRTVTKPQEMGHTKREVDYWSTYDAVVDQGIMRACKHLTAGLESLLDSYVPTEGDSAIFTTTEEELFFICDQKLSNPAVRERYAGNESFTRVNEMLNELKKNAMGRKTQKIQLVTSNSLDVFR